MNQSSLGLRSIQRILGDVDAHLVVRWRVEDMRDGYELGIDVYDSGPDGIALRQGDEVHGRSRIDGRLIATLNRRVGAGPLVDAILDEVQRTSQRTFDLYALRKLLRRVDMAFFAADHDGGHGEAVAAGLKELWAASGPDTWKAYADKRDELLYWVETFA